MPKTWSADNPKAGLMARKRAALVQAALDAFLENGYAEASVNRIATMAGVSIKTLYRHFESKDDLFSAVMQLACGRIAGPEDQRAQPAWYDQPPETALGMAGADYLHHILTKEQIALYRVVVRDAHRFPELGQCYRKEVVGARDAIFKGYLERWTPRMRWTIGNPDSACETFASLLRAGTLDKVLQGAPLPDDSRLLAHARSAGAQMLLLLDKGNF
jgi:TetR/AcrR family transcriptional repressor of mexJK operon